MSHRWVQITALVVLAGCSAAWAQAQGETGVVGDGSVTITLQPELMRLRVELMAKGKDLKEALAKLKDRREAARKKIVELGATEKSIEIAPPSLSAAKADERRQMEMLMRARMAGRKSEKAAEGKERPVTVTAMLTAEWPLKTQDPDELLIFANDLQEKIKAADLAGLKEMEAKNPEEAEEMEESESEMGMYGSEQGPKPGEPAFVFVASVPADRLDKATAEAFGKAKIKAERLAKAASTTTRGLLFLSSSQRPDYGRLNQYRYGYAYSSYFQELVQQSYSPEGYTTEEAIGAEPGPVTFRVNVTATFAIK